MTDIIIYELAKTEPIQVVPALVKKCLENQWKVVVQCASEELRDDLNSLLWTFEKESFVPHGTEADGFPEKQPVFLTHKCENPNGAKVKMMLGMIEVDEIASISDFDRYMIIIDEKDPQIVKVRDEFCEHLAKAGHQAKCQNQNSNGEWSEREIK